MSSSIDMLSFQVLTTSTIAALVAYVVYQRFFSPLARIPGPFLASQTRFWIVQAIRSGHYHRIIQNLHTKYGPIVRITPNHVSISDRFAFRKIYSSGGGFRKSDFYTTIKGARKFDLFATTDETVHGKQRKLVARAFTMETLKDLEPYVDNIVDVFLRKMDEHVGTTFDIANWMPLFAFDVISELTWSTNFGLLKAGKDDGIIRTIDKLNVSASWVTQVPCVFHIHNFFMPVIGNWINLNIRNGRLRDFAITHTEKRKERPVEHKDMVGRMLDIHAQKSEEFQYADVVSVVTSNVNAGADTTSVALRAILYFVLKNPAIKKTLVEEIDNLNRRGELSMPPLYNQTTKMKYLQAVLHEALRLHPSLGMNLPRVVPAGGLEVSGQYIPAGTIVSANPWVIHLDKAVYGEDAEQFRPERWLGESTGDMVRYFFAFGAGSRACIGRNIAWLEMSKLIPSIFLRYDVELAEPEQDWIEECGFFVHQKNINIKLRPRLETSLQVEA